MKQVLTNPNINEKGRIIQEKALQWENKAKLKEQNIKKSRREESIQEIQEINGHIVGAIKAKLSLIDSFEI